MKQVSASAGRETSRKMLLKNRISGISIDTVKHWVTLRRLANPNPNPKKGKAMEDAPEGDHSLNSINPALKYTLAAFAGNA